MRISVLELFPRFYDEQQTASAAVHIAHLDMQLIEDGTYFVHEANCEVVACGGWSRRNKLYSGPGDAEDDDRLLDPESQPARVRAIFVRSDWTRRGLGRAILDPCVCRNGAADWATAVTLNEPATPAASTTRNFSSAGAGIGWTANERPTSTGGWMMNAP
jgi:GNAT superfamily N-acetyltransferase